MIRPIRLVFFLPAVLIALIPREASASEAQVRSFDRLAQRQGFTREIVTTDPFSLLAYARVTAPGKPLRVYIEGDGRAWRTKRVLSDDPTPGDTLVLRLASLDPTENVAYLARPCQFFPEQPACADPAYWSDKRFAPEVVRSLDEAVSRLKALASASRVELVGFSGGGALALLVAKDREDVTGVRTVAGNLDHRAFNEYHHTTPMERSLNPADFLPELQGMAQRHYACRADRVVPKKLTERFLGSLGARGLSALTVIDHCSHHKGWDKLWPGLIALPLAQVGEARR